jgi:hypothetical protein
MDRLVTSPPGGPRIEPVSADGKAVWIRLVEIPGAPED